MFLKIARYFKQSTPLARPATLQRLHKISMTALFAWTGFVSVCRNNTQGTWNRKQLLGPTSLSKTLRQDRNETKVGKAHGESKGSSSLGPVLLLFVYVKNMKSKDQGLEFEFWCRTLPGRRERGGGGDICGGYNEMNTNHHLSWAPFPDATYKQALYLGLLSAFLGHLYS